MVPARMEFVPELGDSKGDPRNLEMQKLNLKIKYHEGFVFIISYYS